MKRCLCMIIWMLLLSVSLVLPTYGKDSNDWKNRQYTLNCGTDKPVTIYVRNSQGKGPPDNDYNSYELYVQAVTRSQDLTGDGKPETAVLLGCSPRPSNSFIQEVQIFTDGSKLLTKLTPLDLPPVENLNYATFDSREFVIRGGKLVTDVWYRSLGSDSSVHRILTWRWNGQRLEIEKEVEPQSTQSPVQSPRAVVEPTRQVRLTNAGDSFWIHNGSLMRLLASGNERVFEYEVPTPGMRAAGVQKGTILFNGVRQGNRYFGTARVFSKYCNAPLEYRVEGYVVTETDVVLTGQREVYAAGCVPTGRMVQDTLEFRYRSK